MSQVWDATIVNDELDLLEFRLRYLANIVDRFVVVEAPLTFSGVAKPLHVTDNLDRFAPWADKLDLVVASLDQEAESPWLREGQQRDAMYERASTAPRGTLIISCDVDEVPYSRTISELADSLEQPTFLEMRHQLYFANWLLESDWVHGFAVRVEDVERTRQILNDPSAAPLALQPSAGNHYSFLGGEVAIAAKFGAYSHQEFNTNRTNNRRHLERCLQNRVHFSGARVLTVTPRSRWDPQQRQLFEMRSNFFDESSPPSTAASRSVAAWCWLRRRSVLPAWLVAKADSQEHWLLVAMRGPLLLLYGLLQLHRRRRRRSVRRTASA